MRTEKDSLGEKQIPDDALWGVQVARAVENFPISDAAISPELVQAYAQLKKACAQANKDLGVLKSEHATPILEAIEEVLAGKHADQFVIDQYQAGAGTSTNMNLNEVIANRALQLMGHKPGEYDILSPNDHVNMAQSTNDTFPTAMRVAVAMQFDKLDAGLKTLEDSFKKKGKQFAEVIKSGRTHLQDAVPITLGQEFAAYGHTVSEVRAELARANEAVKVLGIGGSAVGTGINTHPDYAKKVVDHLNKNTGLGFKNSPDMVESMQSQKQMLQFAAALKLAATEISRIASDLRLLVSGPNTGMNEILLPAVQPGSSIMPGKVNPSILECVNMVCYRVIGAEAAIAYAVHGGQLELNVNMPLMASESLHAMKILGNAGKVVAEKCIDGIEPNIEQLEKYAYASASLATVLNPILGYAKVAEVVKEFVRTGDPLPDIILRQGLMTESELKHILDPKKMTQPGIAEKG